jgi:AcrR family transcriptional regulator
VSRGESERRLLDAVESILVEGGDPGVNAIARAAGLDKVLIYRYFDNLDGLFRKFAERVNIWRSVRREFERGLLERRWINASEASIALFGAYQDRVSKNPLFQQVLIWETNYPDSVLAKAAQLERDREGDEVIRLMRTHFPEDLTGIDVAALGAFFVGAITFLAMKGTRSEPYNGVDMTTEEGWERLRRFWETVIRRMLPDRKGTQ